MIIVLVLLSLASKRNKTWSKNLFPCQHETEFGPFEAFQWALRRRNISGGFQSQTAKLDQVSQCHCEHRVNHYTSLSAIKLRYCMHKIRLSWLHCGFAMLECWWVHTNSHTYTLLYIVCVCVSVNTVTNGLCWHHHCVTLAHFVHHETTLKSKVKAYVIAINYVFNHPSRSQVLAFKSSKQSRQFTCCADCSESVSRVSNYLIVLSSLDPKPIWCLQVFTSVLTAAAHSVFPQVWLQYNISQADTWTLARYHQGDRRHVWHQRPLLLPVSQVAAHVQHFLLPGQLWVYHHPAACLRPLTKHTPKRDLQGPGDTDGGCKWRRFSN